MAELGGDERSLPQLGAPERPGPLQPYLRRAFFPAHVGRNWDALADALGDLGRPGDPGMVLLLLNSGRMRRESGAGFQTAMDVLQAGSAEWAGRRCPLWVFVALEESECRTGG